MARDAAPRDEAPHGSGGWWDWHPHKTAMEFLWRTGELAVSRRQGFQKVYAPVEAVIPEAHRGPPPDGHALVDWACSSALDRLGIATSGELAAFWDAVPAAAAAGWVRERLGQDLVEVAVDGADGGPPRRAVARPELLESLQDLPEPPSRLRLLSPFDPVLRDRARARRVFGFDYRIEVFVPAHRRRYGYYVFPMLEGDRMIGRTDLKLHRDRGELQVLGLWWEPGVRAGRLRRERLHAELARMARFVGAERVVTDGARGDAF